MESEELASILTDMLAEKCAPNEFVIVAAIKKVGEDDTHVIIGGAEVPMDVPCAMLDTLFNSLVGSIEGFGDEVEHHRQVMPHGGDRDPHNTH